jgi:hypothetical protein
MKRHLIAILLMLLPLTGCDDSNKPGNVKTSGTETIDNSIYPIGNDYYSIGFNFSLAKKVSSRDTPKPDIILNNEGLSVFILQTNSGLNGFFLAGEYADAASAKQAFDNLTAPVVSGWAEWANPVIPNQVWVYRSADEHYAKIRIISTFSEERTPIDYAECTFEWVYQPDGTLAFPGK